MNLTTARHLLLAGVTCALVAACAGSSGSATPSTAPVVSPSPAGSSPAAATGAPTATGSADASSAGSSQAPDTGGGTTVGDVPDNAVFLTYQQASLGFSIQYVEGWQVTTQSDGVVIHDKDSSETVVVVPPQSDVAAYITGTDLPALQGQAGYRLIKQDTVKVGAATLDHLAYHILSPADPVTGKQVLSTVDRYYMPSANGLAIVSLSTPDGVDNVDAFRQMIESFKWG